VFGLRPISRVEEGEIVKGWLEREERRGLAIGQLWYLISMDWWRNWNDYVSNTYKVVMLMKKICHILFHLSVIKLLILERWGNVKLLFF